MNAAEKIRRPTRTAAVFKRALPVDIVMIFSPWSVFGQGAALTENGGRGLPINRRTSLSKFDIYDSVSAKKVGSPAPKTDLISREH